MKAYPAYRDIGASWFGEAPQHWEKYRLKYLIRLASTASVHPRKIGLENIESGTGHFIQTEGLFEGDGTHFKEGDLVYGKLRPYLQKVWIASFEGNAVGDFYVFNVLKKIGVKYLWYLIISQNFTNIACASTYGAKMPRVAANFIRGLKCSIPAHTSEQNAIVTYLDKKCAEIDELVSRRQAIIERLKELKQSIIADAVTKGLNPDVPMKDSGAEWMGEVPAHWEVRRFSVEFSERRTKVSDKEYSPLSVTKSGILPQLEKVAKTDNGDNRKLVKIGDFVINSRSDRKGSSGLSSYEGSVSLINHVLIPSSSWNRTYIHHLLRSIPFQEEFYRKGHGIVADLWTTRYADMASSYIPFPPQNEQQVIANHLDKKCAEIDTLISRQEQVIEKLKELKTSTIAHVVTGKVDVRDTL